jgi:hypothetical protein
VAIWKHLRRGQSGNQAKPPAREVTDRMVVRNKVGAEPMDQERWHIQTRNG